jgi:hypothetical protein
MSYSVLLKLHYRSLYFLSSVHTHANIVQGLEFLLVVVVSA